MPSAALRLAGEAAFVALVALGGVLAGLNPIVIAAVAAVAIAVVALVERGYAREARRASPTEEQAGLEATSQAEAAPEPPPEVEAPPAPEPQLAVSKRSARAILATGSPPVSEPAPPQPVPGPEPVAEAEPQPAPPPEPEPVRTGSPGEWNIWGLERLVREQPDHVRRDEWAAMVVSLRDFARADGTLPPEFDDLVRESFGGLLETEQPRAEAATAP
jgi:outer membrane biosynthesis protein TonB